MGAMGLISLGSIGIIDIDDLSIEIDYVVLIAFKY
jgi:hypothetical protein